MNPSALAPSFNRSLPRPSSPPLDGPPGKLRATLGLLSLAALLPVHAEVLLTDSFNYAQGPVVSAAGTTWRTLTGTTAQIQAGAGTLQLQEGEFEIVETPLPGEPRTTGTLYAGFTLTVTALPSGTGAYVAAFSATDGPRTLGRVFVTTQGAAQGTFRLGVAEVLGSPTATLGVDLALNTPHRVVLRHQLPFHFSTLWVNPASEQTGGVEPTESTFPGAIAAFAFRQQLSGGNGTGTLAVDDLVVATTFDEAKTPPLPPKPSLDPQLLGSWEGGYVTDVKAAGNFAYAIRNGGFIVLDVSDPANLRPVGELPTGSFGSVALAGTLAYVTGDGLGLRVIDVSDPANPRQIGSLNTGSHTVVAVAGSHAYLADAAGGLRVVDVTDPTRPRQLARLNAPRISEGLALSGQHAYLSVDNVSTSGLWVIDLGNPQFPRRVGQISVSEPGNFFVDVVASGGFVYAAEWGSSQFGGGMNVIDVSNPANPVRVAHVPFGTLEGLTVADGLAFLTGPSDFAVYDVSDPAVPKRVGTGPAGLGAFSSPVVSDGRLFLGNLKGLSLLTLPKLPPPLAFSAPARLEAGGLRLSLRGPAGQAFEIQRSPRLGDWQPWVNGTLGAAEMAEFLDESASTGAGQFYRLLSR